MATRFTEQSRQEWIQAYRQAHKQLDKAQCSLSALINLLNGNPIEDGLQMDPSEREGLHNLLADIATQIADALYENLPVPKVFEDLCNGGQSNE